MTDESTTASAPPLPSPAATKFCFACAASIDARAEICPKCGVRQPVIPGVSSGGGVSTDAVTATGKTRMTAALLAIFLGGLGVHKFYLGDTNKGILYLVFFWTLFPAIVGFIEGLIMLMQPNAEWLAKYGDR